MITEQELKDLNYGPELKGKLEELGVGDAWKDGKKKSAIISDAMVKLAVIQSQKDAGASDEDAQKALEKVEEGKELASQEAKEGKAAIKANADALKQEADKFVPSKEQAQKGIDRILLLIKTANGTQKEILSKRLAQLQAIVDGE